MLLLVLGGVLWWQLNGIEDRHRERAQSIGLPLVTAEIAQHLIASPSQINGLLESLWRMPAYDAVCLYVTAGGSGERQLIHRGPWSRECPTNSAVAVMNGENQFISRAFSYGESGQGVLAIKLVGEIGRLFESGNIFILLAATCLSIGFLVWASARLASRLITPLQRVQDVLREIQRSGDYQLHVPAVGYRELNELSDDLNSMIETVANREKELISAQRELELRVREVDISNAELSTALWRLNAAKDRLIVTEKMASLGGLVAGVAHEINTPVGVGVTAASSMLGQARDVLEKYNSGQLTNSGLKSYLETTMETAELVLGNLARAAELVRSFKRVAVDQEQGDVRRFSLKGHCEEVLRSLYPQLKHTNIKCVFDCEDGLMVNTYPGALSQIITNFVMNSVNHGFDVGAHGELNLSLRSIGDSVEMVYRDNGCGIPPENLDKVFDPFFTTGRAQGGSGLGMHIVYNLVTQQLAGEIELSSQPGDGVEIIVRFPKDLGEEEEYVGAR